MSSSLYAHQVVAPMRWGRWHLREAGEQLVLEHDDPTSKGVQIARLTSAVHLARALDFLRREPWCCALDLGTFVLAVAALVGLDFDLVTP